MFYESIKRLIDIIASVFLIILFLPFWIIIPLVIKLDTKGTIFFFQDRVGKNGQLFKIVKFRTMFEGSDDFWTEGSSLGEKAKESGWKLTLEQDTRVTRLGKILRQISVDEFPQLFNILKGDMSLVGPRPLRQIEIADAVLRYGKEIKSIIDESLTVKPGLTGPWQVSGRNDISWDQRVQIDANYAKRKNILDDFAIIFKTPFAMISKW